MSHTPVPRVEEWTSPNDTGSEHEQVDRRHACTERRRTPHRSGWQPQRGQSALVSWPEAGCTVGIDRAGRYARQHADFRPVALKELALERWAGAPQRRTRPLDFLTIPRTPQLRPD